MNIAHARRKCLALALAAALSASAGAADTERAPVEPWPESRSSESFDALLKKIFSGDPGGDGWGILDMRATVSFPALSETEIARLFTGNTIYQDADSQVHFAADGTMTGTIEGKPLVEGQWRVKDGFVCMDDKVFKLGCNYAALVVDRVIFFRPNGKARFTGLVREGR